MLESLSADELNEAIAEISFVSDRRRAPYKEALAVAQPQDIVRLSEPKVRSCPIFGAHPKWRRLSGITFKAEFHLEKKDRKRGLRRVSKWLEKNWQGKRKPKAQSEDGPGETRRAGDVTAAPPASAVGENVRASKTHREGEGPPEPHVFVPPHKNQTPMGATAPSFDPTTEEAAPTHVSTPPNTKTCGSAGASPSHAPTHSESRIPNPEFVPAPTHSAIRNPKSAIRPTANLSLASEWDLSAKSWSCIRARGPSVESLCRDLEIRKAELTSLMREHCGLSTDEVVDNFRLHKLQGALRDRVRSAARRIWGMPQDIVNRKICEVREAQIRQRQQHIDNVIARKGSAKDLFDPDTICPSREKREQERLARLDELVEALRKDFDMEMWSESLGFQSQARLKRACLRVLGRTLSNLERLVATEVVKYYLAAEDKKMREMAMDKSKDECTKVARLLYWGQNEPPTEPFLDHWSLYEWAERSWLEAMHKDFGYPDKT